MVNGYKTKKLRMENTGIVIYQTEKTKTEARLEDETVWLTIDQMAALFQKSRSAINEHILNIYEEKELDKQQTMRKIGNSDFSPKSANYCSHESIISAGFAMNDGLLKQAGGNNYFRTRPVYGSY